MDHELTELVRRDLVGTATEEESSALRCDASAAREWREVLVVMLQECDRQLTALRAEVSEREQESRRRGPSGKSEYFQYKSKKETERARLVERKTRIIERIRETKTIHREELEQSDESYSARLDRIEDKVDEILALLLKGHEP